MRLIIFLISFLFPLMCYAGGFVETELISDATLNTRYATVGDTGTLKYNDSTFSSQTGSKFSNVAVSTTTIYSQLLTDTGTLKFNLSSFTTETGTKFSSVATTTTTIYSQLLTDTGTLKYGLSTFTTQTDGKFSSVITDTRTIAADTGTIAGNLSTFSAETTSKFSNVAVDTTALGTNLSTFAGQDFAYLSSTQTFTGINTFASTVTLFGGVLQSTGGNARGEKAIDLQITRAADTQVASGIYSVIVGGVNNTAASEYCVIFGGTSNKIYGDGTYQAIVGGQNNIAYNTLTDAGATVLGGLNNYSSGYSAVTVGGGLNSALGKYSLAAGYRSSSTANGSVTFSDSLNVEKINNVTNGLLLSFSGGTKISMGDIYASSNVVIAGTITIQGNAFSVGTSSFSVKTGFVVLPGYTKVGLQALQVDVGGYVRCTDCTIANVVCTSTHADVGSTVYMHDGTTSCHD